MPTGKYAKDTNVSPDKSMADIRTVLRRYGATKVMTLEENTHIGIAFEAQRRRVRFLVPLPSRDETRVVQRNQYESSRVAKPITETQYEQAVRQRWRALYVAILGKLESIESGIETFEQAFQSQIVLPTGETVGEWIAPQIAVAYDSGVMPPLLPTGG